MILSKCESGHYHSSARNPAMIFRLTQCKNKSPYNGLQALCHLVPPNSHLAPAVLASSGCSSNKPGLLSPHALCMCSFLSGILFPQTSVISFIFIQISSKRFTLAFSSLTPHLLYLVLPFLFPSFLHIIYFATHDIFSMAVRFCFPVLGASREACLFSDVSQGCGIAASRAS